MNKIVHYEKEEYITKTGFVINSYIRTACGVYLIKGGTHRYTKNKQDVTCNRCQKTVEMIIKF